MAEFRCVTIPMLLFFQRLLGRRDLLIPHFEFNTIARAAPVSELLTRIHRLRYEVYCMERAFLDAAAYPDGIESDHWDGHSAHVAAHARDGDIVGTVRLVCPAEGQAFPFEAQCEVFDELVLPPRAESAEVSRLIVQKTFRRGAGKAGADSPDGVETDARARRHGGASGNAGRANNSLLLLGMYRALYRYSVANGIRYWYAAMERSLAGSLDKMGFPPVPIGPEGDYYGPVTLHLVDLRDLERRVAAASPFMMAWFRDEKMPFWLVVKTLAGRALRGAARF
ncbi:PEP-CTERM/exosortase system-associated acyltransferase [Massilia antarctica]|uniref:PEP-CTERM/exosortase system-associated acyltransferase n=1 Tax=Massilia antarctica TaxID=2765360 RepID=UPI0027D98DC9|nr:PEP-CTERM/exosortase system-associated acyltransferase [Massilia antarctica]